MPQCARQALFFRLLGPAHRACRAQYSFRNRFRPYLLTKLVFITPPLMKVLPLSQKSLAPLRAACWDNAALVRALAQDVARACAAVCEQYTAAIQQLSAYFFTTLRYRVIDCVRDRLGRKSYATASPQPLAKPDHGIKEAVPAADLSAAPAQFSSSAAAATKQTRSTAYVSPPFFPINLTLLHASNFILILNQDPKGSPCGWLVGQRHASAAATRRRHGPSRRR